MCSRYNTIIFLIWLIMSACSNGQRSGGQTAGLLPADSIAVHFWDNPSLFQIPVDSVVVEQHFADFLGLLRNLSADTRSKAVDALVKNMRQPDLIVHYTDHYLYDPNSPMRDEELYILFARRMLGSGMLDDAGRMRMEAYLEEAVKNRPGSRAADFAYITRGGEKATLHTTAPGRTLLLIFYDPDCTHCAETIGRLGSDAGIIRQIDEGSLAVLAVYPDANTDLWQSTAGTLPERWIVGRAESPDDISDLYSIPATPVIYLLDPNRRVIAKDIKL